MSQPSDTGEGLVTVKGGFDGVGMEKATMAGAQWGMGRDEDVSNCDPGTSDEGFLRVLPASVAL